MFDDEFRQQVRAWQDAPARPGRQASLAWTARKVAQILGLPEEKLLRAVMLPSQRA